jgi:hypothetical protein
MRVPAGPIGKERLRRGDGGIRFIAYAQDLIEIGG